MTFFRAIFDLLITVILAFVARAILGSIMKGFKNAAQGGFQQTGSDSNSESKSQGGSRQSQPRVVVAGELHKDPVCGMYVAESTQYQRRSGSQTFYYCSGKCKDQHALVAKA